MKRKTYLMLTVIITTAAVAASVSLTGCSDGNRKTADADSETKVMAIEEMRVRTAEDAPRIKIGEYRLAVTGMVKNTLSLTYPELKSLPAEKRLVTLPCVEGWSEKAYWKGPRLEELLNRSGVNEGVKTVVFYSPGGYSTSLTMKDVKETDPFLAYEVNGEPLPHDQGFPLRLVVPGRLGYKWIKWVEKIQLVSGGYEGFWENRGYSNEARP